MSRTTKKCPGCKQVDPQRRADDVCRECRGKLNSIANLHEQMEVLAKRKLTPFRCQEFWGKHNYFNEALPYVDSGIVDDIQEQLYRLLKYTTLPALAWDWYTHKWDDSGDHERYADPELIEVIGDVIRVFYKGLKRSHDVGVEEGSDLLLQLAEGRINNADICEYSQALGEKELEQQAKKAAEKWKARHDWRGKEL